MTYWNAATKTAAGALALVAAVVGFDDRYAKAGEMAGKLDGGLYARDLDQYREDEKERRAGRYVPRPASIRIPRPGGQSRFAATSAYTAAAYSLLLLGAPAACPHAAPTHRCPKILATLKSFLSSLRMAR